MIDELARAVEATVDRASADLINSTGNPDHPLTKLTSQLAGVIRTVDRTTLSVAHAVAAGHELRAKTGLAGLAYQDEVYAATVALLKGTDDEPELKGRVPGATGGAEGDIVITVDPKLTGGRTARVAIEGDATGIRPIPGEGEGQPEEVHRGPRRSDGRARRPRSVSDRGTTAPVRPGPRCGRRCTSRRTPTSSGRSRCSSRSAREGVGGTSRCARS